MTAGDETFATADATGRVRAQSDEGLKSTKTGRTRSVWLLGPLAADLAAWRLAHGRPSGPELVFPTTSGEPTPGLEPGTSFVAPDLMLFSPEVRGLIRNLLQRERRGAVPGLRGLALSAGVAA